MKTIRLASLTALISSVVLDYADAGDLPSGTPLDEQLTEAQLDMDDPELAADAEEFEKEKAEAVRAKKVRVPVGVASPTPAPTPELRKINRKTISNTKPLHKRIKKF